MSQHMPHSGHDVHAHAHGYGHQGHVHATGFKGWLQELFVPHSHDAADQIDTAMEASSQGIRAVKFSLLGLGATSIFQLVIVLASGSVALMADTVHNFSDALTTVLLWIAFLLGRRATTRTYTYGFAGNELVAVYRIRVGRKIGSASLVADGIHARTDGFTSLAVVGGVIGIWLGFPLADPIVGLLISAAIAVLLWGTVRDIGRRLHVEISVSLTGAEELWQLGRLTDSLEQAVHQAMRNVGSVTIVPRFT